MRMRIIIIPEGDRNLGDRPDVVARLEPSRALLLLRSVLRRPREFLRPNDALGRGDSFATVLLECDFFALLERNFLLVDLCVLSIS